MRIIASDATLIDYDILNSSVEITQGKEGLDSQNDINISVGRPNHLGLSEDGQYKICSITVTVESEPANEAAFYKCRVLLGGTFAIRRESKLDDALFERIVSTQGVEELYGLVRSVVAKLTSSSLYGTYLLPSIKIIAEDNQVK